MDRWDSLSVPIGDGLNPDSPILLTDGSVLLAHLEPTGMSWFRYSPDLTGSYTTSKWMPVAGSHATRYGNIAAVVLASGRVFVTGGAAPSRVPWVGEIYDPGAAEPWTPITGSSAGWSDSTRGICAVLLPDGRVMCAASESPVTAIYAPGLDSPGGWQSAGPHESFAARPTTTLTHDGYVLDISPGDSGRFFAAPAEWAGAGRPPFDPGFAKPEPAGPLLQLMDVETGTAGEGLSPAIAFGSGAEYAYRFRDGRWLFQRGFPPRADGTQPQTSGRAAVLLPSGRVLVVADDTFYTVDPAAAIGDAVVAVSSPAVAGGPAFSGADAHLLLLPTGQVMAFSRGRIDLYTPDTDGPAPRDAWRPVIATIDGAAGDVSLVFGADHVLTGQWLTGWSNAVSQAVTESTATNYPIVRLRQPSGATVYCRTHDHRGADGVTLAGVANFSATVTNFFVPEPDDGNGLTAGDAELTVIVNGIPSISVRVTLSFPIQSPGPERHLWQVLIGNLADGQLWYLGHDHVFHPVPPGPNDGKVTEVESAVRRANDALADLAKLGALKDAALVSSNELKVEEVDKG